MYIPRLRRARARWQSAVFIIREPPTRLGFRISEGKERLGSRYTLEPIIIEAHLRAKMLFAWMKNEYFLESAAYKLHSTFSFVRGSRCIVEEVISFLNEVHTPERSPRDYRISFTANGSAFDNFISKLNSI